MSVMKKTSIFLTLFFNLFLHSQETYLDKNYVLGKFDYKIHPLFELVEETSWGKKLYLHKEVAKKFRAMKVEAKKDGVKLSIVSATRSFKEQKVIWENKWKKFPSQSSIDKAKDILQYSSMPSTSRHHWGTDIDLNNLENSYFENGVGKKVYDWLKLNAHKFGFYQVYEPKIIILNGASFDRAGYNEEKWHWSYLPLALEFKDFYCTNISYDDINGFLGSDVAEDVFAIEDYVLSIRDEMMLNQSSLNSYEISQSFHQNGNVESIGQKINGLKEGIWKEYFSNGRLSSIKHYKRDSYHGMLTDFYYDYPSQKKLDFIFFKNGEVYGLIRKFKPDGRLYWADKHNGAKYLGEITYDYLGDGGKV